MAKQKQDSHFEIEEEYPLQILYSSPPEAARLNDWIRDVEGQKDQESGQQNPANER